MATRWLSPSLQLSGDEHVIFTSETAVRAFARLELRRSFQTWCVGEHTAKVAALAGFNVLTGPGDARGLVGQIAKSRPETACFWPHGADTAFDIARALMLAGVRTSSAIVYDQMARPLSTEASEVLRQACPVLVPLFSTRSAALFAEEGRCATAPLLIAAIGATAAQKVAVLKPEKCIVAAKPDSESLLDALDQLAHPSATG
jgi:uroporphyrinogen-III synthase